MNPSCIHCGTENFASDNGCFHKTDAQHDYHREVHAMVLEATCEAWANSGWLEAWQRNMAEWEKRLKT
jgi:hypothetical protein